MSTRNRPEIKLTDNTLENIIIMAPYLNEVEQNQVFGLMLGIIKSIPDKKTRQAKQPQKTA